MANDLRREAVYLAGLVHDARVGGVLKTHRAALERLGLSFTSDGLQLSPEDATIIDQADRLACGFDRIEVESGNDPVALVNLLGMVLVNGEAAKTKGTFDLQPLTLSDSAFAKSETRSGEDLKNDSERLWRQFADEATRLPTGSLAAFTGSLHHLLRRFAWCVPASAQTGGVDVSLFHHLKLTGALAQCLFDFRAAPLDTFPLQLLCVDLSGIQGFIYNIASKYAAKSLKGRSFSLQALLDGIARKLIGETRSSPSHLVYSSGGKFFMLLSNTAAINQTLDRLRDETERAVWDEYGGSLYVCFGRVAFRYEPGTGPIFTTQKPTEGQQLGSLWKAVADEAAAQKQQKNRRLLLDKQKFNDLFGASGEGGNTRQCTVTGLEGNLVKPKREKGELWILETVNQQIEIGKALAEHQYKLNGGDEFRLLAGLEAFSLPDKKPGAWPVGGEALRTLQPDTERGFLPDDAPPTQTTFGFRFFGGSRVAKRDGKAKNFEELTGLVRENPDDDESPIDRANTVGQFHRLGILRMDVDNLGKLFTHGFKGEQASFSAYATLSGLLDWFFSGYLNTIREKEEYRDWVNIVYSGGDDVFAVGRWDRVIDFADEIQRDFKRFTGRDDLTLSAGIELVRPRFPIGKAAELAGEAEGKAKNHQFCDQVKNAVCLFEIAINWDLEWPAVVEWKNKLVVWLRSGQLSKGILQKLFSYYLIHKNNELKKQEAERNHDKEFKPDLAWKWNSAYSLARHRKRDNAEIIDELKELLFTRISPTQFRFEAFAVALRWAELEYRDFPKTKTSDGTSN